MSGLVEWIQAALGYQSNESIGPPGVVVLVPDDYTPPIRGFGVFSAGAAAGGVGTRSEIAIIAPGAARTGDVLRITELEVAGTNASDELEIVTTAGITGFTDVPHVSSDLRRGSGIGFIQTSIVAAATTTVSVVVAAIQLDAALVYVKVPGEFILEAGVPTVNRIVVRSRTDQRGVLVKCAVELLARRKL